MDYSLMSDCIFLIAAKYHEAKKLNAVQRKKISTLHFDVTLAHSYWRESERNLKKTEQSMFSWIRRARKAETMHSLLYIANDAAKAAREQDLSSLSPKDITAFETRYDAII